MCDPAHVRGDGSGYEGQRPGVLCGGASMSRGRNAMVSQRLLQQAAAMSRVSAGVQWS
ncbi:hypothetical protein N9N28_12415 [Rubripirellula amarantea]|nr:hypothetical protein [Rubripirellula amarantea]